MWERNIEVKNGKVAEYIYSRIKKELEEVCVITLNKNSSYYQIAFACEDYDQARVKLFLNEIIIDTICTFYKNEFLESRLNLPVKEGIYVKALKKALLSFDKETDAYIIAKNLNFDKNLNIDGFYYFNLKSLREKWEELASIANDNGYFLMSDENFIDLLKFLVDNLEITHETVNVYCDEDQVKIYDDMNNYEIKEGDDLLTTLIGLSPKRINFFGDNKSEKYLIISQVFEKRLNFL